MIWTILGFSVAIIAAFCVALCEVFNGHPWFESLRQTIAITFWGAGAVLGLLGLLFASLDKRRKDASARFILFDLRFLGPICIVLGAITFFVHPLMLEGMPASGAAEVAPKPKTPSLPQGLKIQGIIYKETQPFAIVNGQSYSIGDHVGDAVVRAIDRTGVTLEVDGHIKVYSVD